MRREAELEEKRIEAEFKRDLFISDFPHGLEGYKAVYPEDFERTLAPGEEPDDLTPTSVDEYLPKSEKDVDEMLAEIRQLGLTKDEAGSHQP